MHTARRDSPRGRYRDDLNLILADHDIAAGDTDQAGRRLARVVEHPSCPVADRLARLGLAELDRLAGNQRHAADAFAALFEDTASRGATWLQIQALVGLALCDDDRALSRWAALGTELPAAASVADPRELAVGEPRVLWLLTI